MPAARSCPWKSTVRVSLSYPAEQKSLATQSPRRIINYRRFASGERTHTSMHTRFAISLLLLLAPGSDLPKVNSLRPPATPLPTNFPPGESIPMLPVITIDPQDTATPQDPAKKSPTLQESSKLTLIRFVSGEFAKARKPLPAGKDGFIIFVGKPLDEQFL